MYITLLEKMKAVDEDFRKSPLYLLGDVPATEAEQKPFFHNACTYATAYIEKYKEFSGDPIHEYVKDLVTDYMRYLERAAKQIREGSKHETNT